MKSRLIEIAKIIGVTILIFIALRLINPYVPIFDFLSKHTGLLMAFGIGCTIAGNSLGKYVQQQKNKLALAQRQNNPSNPIAESLNRAIAERKKTDPLIGIKIGGKEINQRVMDALKKVDSQGVHIGSLLTILGSLGGFACQIRARTILTHRLKLKQVSDNDLIHVVEAGGKKYFFGDPINKFLSEDQYSIWSLAAGAAQGNGCTELLDVREIHAYVTETVGSELFGVPRVPDDQKAFDTPEKIVIAFWPLLFPVVQNFCDSPDEWPMIYGAAIQETINLSKNVIDPKLALKIVMECAVPMSKIDLDNQLKLT